MRKIDICNRSKIVEPDKNSLRDFLRTLDKKLPQHLQAPKGTLSLVILDDDEIAQIHADFMNKPDATDVITFEGDNDSIFAGEICASAQTALKYSKCFGTTPSQELSLYFAHGYLHLAGVDDIAPEDALKMRAAEAIAMNILKENFKSPIFKFKRIK